jgi:GDPmannose 4,6-dehydratase
MMLQQDKPEDFVIATGRQISVRDFVVLAAREIGVEIAFSGSGKQEVGTVTAVNGDLTPGIRKGDVIVRVDPAYYRPAEVEELLGDPAKTKQKLGWVPEITVEQMITEMMATDMEKAKQHALLKAHGHDVNFSRE